MNVASPSHPYRKKSLGWQSAFLACFCCLLTARGAEERVADIVTPATTCVRLAELHAPSAALLGKNTIVVHRAGTLAIDPTDACALLARTNLLDLVQQQYARQLPAGQSPEFTIQHTGTNSYAYVNRHGQQSQVTEVGRQPLAGDGFAILVHALGERDFGTFESLTYVTVVPTTDPGKCRYEVVVHAYPYGCVRRFLARHLGLVERYFRSKTTEMEALVTNLCLALHEQ